MSPEAFPVIAATGLRKSFGDVVALDGFDLEVPRGGILGLLGPSGCGKTTALRVIAGFETPDAGSVTLDGEPAVGPGVWVPPEKRRVGMVFQDFALFPHMTVADNIGYGLRSGSSRRVDEVLELVGLAGLGSRMPHELSGGEQQRVALARALAPKPRVVLLDGPFSNLDAPQRDRVRREVRTILVEARASAVFVTHDQEEALAMSDKVAVMKDGRVLQIASPHDVYHHPVDCWVARFLGEGELVPGTASGAKVETLLGTFRLAEPANGPVEVIIRPEVVRLYPDAGGPVTVVDREFYGHDQLITLELADGRRLLSRTKPNPAFAVGDRVRVEVDEVMAFPEHGHV
ncbi:MAG: ABC transporter ATP-binding protein [Acidimicrobiia bacterium]|nr:ABC transporter ATP-binding protein [Acidimicrobiia bacterium]